MQSCCFAHKTNNCFFTLSLSSSSWLLPSDKIPCSRGRMVKWGGLWISGSAYLKVDWKHLLVHCFISSITYLLYASISKGSCYKRYIILHKMEWCKNFLYTHSSFGTFPSETKLNWFCRCQLK